MRHTYGIRIGLVIMSYLFCVPFSAAQTSQKQQQFNQIKQEFHALKLAYYIDQKCWLLESPSRANADSKAYELGRSMQAFGVTPSALDAFDTDIENSVKDKSCADLAAIPDVKTAQSIANLSAGLNIYIWQAYYKKHPSGVLWRDDCGGSYSNALIKDAVSGQKELSDVFRASAQFTAMDARMGEYVQMIHGVCQKDGGFFKKTYAGDSLFKIVKQAVMVHNGMKAGSGRGVLETVVSSQRWKGFRGTAPKAQFDSDVPWAVLREASEKTHTKSQISAAFEHDSAVHYGMLKDGRIAFSLRAPSMAQFTSDIFKSVVLTDTETGRTWRVNRSKEYYTGYSPEVMASSKIKPGDPHDTIQFIMDKSESDRIVAAIKAGQNIQVQTERFENGQTKLIDVETINQKGFMASFAYAFAEKIDFSKSN